MFKWFYIFCIYIGEQWEEYLAGSSYNFLRYLQRRRSNGERLLWALIIVGISTICGYVIGILYQQYLTNPLTMVYDIHDPSKPLDFPSVYICTDNVLNETRLAQYVKNSDLPMDSTVLQQCIENYVHYKLIHNLSSADCRAFEESINSHTKGNLTELLLDTSRLFRRCQFAGYNFPCSLLLHHVFSEVGHCFYFNNVALESIRHGLRRLDFDQIYSIEETDSSWDFSIQMQKTKRVYTLLLMDTTELPTLKDDVYLKWNGTTSETVGFLYFETKSDNLIRDLSVRQRKCFFWDEAIFMTRHWLTDTYRRSYCFINCHAWMFHHLCGCVPAYYKILFKTFNFDACNLSQLSCVENARQSIESSECAQCLFTCDRKLYVAEDITAVEELHRDFVELKITFDEWPVILRRRRILFGLGELITSLGGVFGLFLGLNMVAPIELFYYFVLNFLGNYIRNRARMQRLAAERLAHVPRIDMSLRLKFT